MDKEMMDKINEVLKANGKRELSMDELDKVVGGSFTYDRNTHMCNINGVPMTAEAFDDMMYTFVEKHNLSVAIASLREITGFDCFEMRDDCAGCSKSEQMGRFAIIMNHFWQVYDGQTHH